MSPGFQDDVDSIDNESDNEANVKNNVVPDADYGAIYDRSDGANPSPLPPKHPPIVLTSLVSQMVNNDEVVKDDENSSKDLDIYYDEINTPIYTATKEEEYENLIKVISADDDDNNNFNYDDIDKKLLRSKYEDAIGEYETIVFHDEDLIGDLDATRHNKGKYSIRKLNNDEIDNVKCQLSTVAIPIRTTTTTTTTMIHTDLISNDDGISILNVVAAPEFFSKDSKLNVVDVDNAYPTTTTAPVIRKDMVSTKVISSNLNVVAATADNDNINNNNLNAELKLNSESSVGNLNDIQQEYSTEYEIPSNIYAIQRHLIEAFETIVFYDCDNVDATQQKAGKHSIIKLYDDSILNVKLQVKCENSTGDLNGI